MTMESLYQERLQRYTTAMRNGKPDMIPIRPFVAEFTAKYAGFTCQEVTHDYLKAFEAARICAASFDWDAVVGNMVYVWTGLTQAIGLEYYGTPGIDVPPNTGFQYLEPAEGKSYMQADEYDELIDDPTGFLYNTWLPRVSRDVSPMGSQTSYRNNLSFVKGGMAMLSYFNAFGEQTARLRTESGTVSAISGILKSPFDILGDKLRGYLGLTMDMYERPHKVLAACEALMPHLLHVAMGGADADRNVPIGFWMHRGCVPFVSPSWYSSHVWPTLKPIIEELWANGHQTLFYAEGNWNAHLDSFAELPDLSVVYHVDSADIFEVHRKLGHKFCLSGGIPNVLLSIGTPDEVRAHCKAVIDGVAGDGGYIMDSSAIIQNDAKVENLRAMTDFTREYGGYSAGHTGPIRLEQPAGGGPLSEMATGDRGAPGVCIPWSEKRAELPALTGDPELARRIWQEIEELSNTYIWQVLLSF